MASNSVSVNIEEKQTTTIPEVKRQSGFSNEDHTPQPNFHRFMDPDVITQIMISREDY